MQTKAVVGTQWGDEGKGKIIDILASEADVVVRSQGGNNAGHTVEHEHQVYKLHLIPSGILYPNTLCLLGCGVVIDPAVLLAEIDGLEERGVSCRNLRIDPRVHIIMPWHRTLDVLQEQALGDAKIGTTGRGIGPCYADKYERIGIRLYDLLREDLLAAKVTTVGTLKNKMIEKVYGGEGVNLAETLRAYQSYATRLQRYVADVSVLTHQAVTAGKQVLFEGAQATLLDIDVGTYPYVTSSHPVAGGCTLGAGVGPTALQEIIGVAKAYTTRVGMGPFPTELDDEVGELIRTRGQEYGTTTGRPRRTGWFDLVMMRHAVRTGGITSIALNKIDPLSDLGELKVCVAYQKPDGTQLTEFPPDIHELVDVTPVYETLPGFSGDFSGCTAFSQLPAACQEYVSFLEQQIGCPITMVGVGPARSQNLIRG